MTPAPLTFVGTAKRCWPQLELKNGLKKYYLCFWISRTWWNISIKCSYQVVTKSTGWVWWPTVNTPTLCLVVPTKWLKSTILSTTGVRPTQSGATFYFIVPVVWLRRASFDHWGISVCRAASPESILLHCVLIHLLFLEINKLNKFTSGHGGCSFLLCFLMWSSNSCYPGFVQAALHVSPKLTLMQFTGPVGT